MSLEDYTIGIKLDANNRYTVTTNKIAVAGLLRNEPDEYVALDKGVAFFDGNFNHKFQTKVTASTGGQVYPWALANTLDDFLPLNDVLGLQVRSGQVFLVEKDGGILYFDSSTTLIINTQYYHTIVRDEAIGSFGQLQCFIYDDAIRTNLIDVLTLALHVKEDWRYVYGVMAPASSGINFITADIENLDLGLAVGFNPSWARNSNQIIGVSQ
ncbi:hypothetical protein KAR91_59210 [Candidatus Pacearchaeota archaeon]|nr:hypothetical protein [Candidatus Pacearchaeota archaeon]